MGTLPLLAAVATMFVTASTASGYASSNSVWGVVCAKGWCFPTGTMLHVIESRGVQVRYDHVQVTSAALMCNWWVDFDYYDNSGFNYKHIQGVERNRCTRNGYVRVNYQKFMGPQDWRSGRACATLYSAAIFISRHCHYLHP